MGRRALQNVNLGESDCLEHKVDVGSDVPFVLIRKLDAKQDPVPIKPYIAPSSPNEGVGAVERPRPSGRKDARRDAGRHRPH